MGCLFDVPESSHWVRCPALLPRSIRRCRYCASLLNTGFPTIRSFAAGASEWTSFANVSMVSNWPFRGVICPIIATRKVAFSSPSVSKKFSAVDRPRIVRRNIDTIMNYPDWYPLDHPVARASTDSLCGCLRDCDDRISAGRSEKKTNTAGYRVFPELIVNVPDDRLLAAQRRETRNHPGPRTVGMQDVGSNLSHMAAHLRYPL